VRGAGFVLTSNNTDAETAVGTTVGLSSFNSNGFTMGTGSTLNDSGQTYIGWQWKGGGTAVSNTNGTITSTVSANTTSGCSVVTYTGTGTTGTIGHGLGVAPSFIIVKSRSNVDEWYCYHASLGATQRIQLNQTSAATSTTLWNSTAPTSSVYSAVGGGSANVSGWTIVAYCFAAIKGFSAFGSYTGNGSTDGPFVYCGFRPRWVMLKVSSTAGYDWLIYDSSRDTYNVTQNNLRADTSDAESTQTANYLDFLSNGFKIRGSSAGSINPSQTVIYAAFAENPFQNSLAR